MKDYNEMADAVFRRRDEYLTAKKKRNGILLKAGASVCALLLVAVVGVSVWRALPSIPSAKPTEPTVTAVIDVTETKEDITTQPEASINGATEVNSDATKPQATKKPVAATDPVESQPSGNTDKPQTETTLPPDPTEPKGDKPATDGSVDPTSATEAPNAPGADSFPGWTPDSMSQPPTTEVCEATTAEACETTPCMTYPDEPLIPENTTPAATVPSVEPTTTEPVAGNLYIECEAQVGDMVNLTVELQADEFINSADIIAKYGYDNLEVVNLWDLGFTKNQLREAHAPNLGDALSIITYNAGNYGNYRAVKLDFSATENEYAADFTEKRVLMTFSFIVKKSGITTIEVVPNEMKSVSGTRYYRNGNQLVSEGIDLEAYLTIIPASEVVLPTPPEEVKTEETPFTYPEESTDGELLINCDGRTYSANIGDTVTFVTELKADEMFENIHIVLDYPDEYLSFNVPEKGKQAFPNMYGMTYNFEGYNRPTINPAVIMTAVDVYGFDFTSRQVLAQLEFEVIKSGEIDLDMHFEDMFKCRAEGFVDEAYFDRGVQKSFDDIYIYEYVLVEDKSSQ